MKYSIVIVFLFFFTTLSAQTTLPPEMVFVQGGTFTRGCTPDQQPECNLGDGPTSLVRLPSFWIGKYEVTQQQWEAVMGNDNPPPYFNNNPTRPMEWVSDYDCLTYCNRLSLLEGFEPVYYFDPHFSSVFDSLVGFYSPYIYIYIVVYVKENANGYRLPTQAEWEYAARGGNVAIAQTKFSGSDDANAVAWYNDNSGGTTHNVGLKQPNILGLFDMSGNVGEWCFDNYMAYAYLATCVDISNMDPDYRGGGYFVPAEILGYRGSVASGSRRTWVGLRLSRTP